MPTAVRLVHLAGSFMALTGPNDVDVQQMDGTFMRRRLDPWTVFNVARIKRKLAETREVQSLDEFRLAYYVSVSAEAPQVDIFKDFDWRKGRAKGLPPTAKELFQQATQQEFSAPVADFTTIATWLGKKISHKKRPVAGPPDSAQ